MLGSALLAAVPGTAPAQDLVEVDLTAFGSGNAFLLEDDDEATFGGEARLRAATRASIDPRTSLDIEGQVGYRRYSRRYGDFVTGTATAAFRHRRSEFLSFVSDAFYDRYLPAETLDDNVDAAIDPLGVRESYGAGQTVAWTPDARSTVQGRVSWIRNEPSGRSPLTGTSAVEVTARAERRVTAFLSVGALAQYTSSDNALGTDPAVRAFRLTAGQRLRDHWRAEVEAGVEQETAGTPGGGRDTGPVRFSGRGEVCYEPQGSTLCLTAGIRSLVSGLGLRRELLLGASGSRQVSVRGMLSFDFTHRRASLPGLDADARVLVVRTEYEHRLARRFFLHGGLDYLRRAQPLFDRIGAVAGRIGIRFREEGR